MCGNNFFPCAYFPFDDVIERENHRIRDGFIIFYCSLVLKTTVFSVMNI